MPRTVVVGPANELVAMTLHRLLDAKHQVHALITPSSSTPPVRRRNRHKFGVPATREFVLFEKVRLRYPNDLNLVLIDDSETCKAVCQLITKCITDVDPDNVLYMLAFDAVLQPQNTISHAINNSRGAGELARESVLSCIQAAVKCPSLPSIVLHAPALLLDVPPSIIDTGKGGRIESVRECEESATDAVSFQNTWDHWIGQSTAPALCSRSHLDAAWQGLRALEETDLSYTVVCTGAVVQASISRNNGWKCNVDATSDDEMKQAWRTPIRTNDLADAFLHVINSLSTGGSLDAWRRRVWVRSEVHREHVERMRQQGATQPLRALIRGRAAETTYATCFQRQVNGVGYRNTVLDLPLVRWGQVDFSEPRPAHQSAVRASRRMVQAAAAAAAGVRSNSSITPNLRVAIDQRRVAGPQLECRALRAASRRAAKASHVHDPVR